MYFNVNNSFAYQLVNGDVTIEVEYFDSFYGSGAAPCSACNTTVPAPPSPLTPRTITTTDSDTWRTVRFEIADAYFGGRQNGSSDFRLNFNGKKLNVNRVWVRLPEGEDLSLHLDQRHRRPGAQLVAECQLARRHRRASPIPPAPCDSSPARRCPAASIPITNNLTGQVFNQLQLGGTASSSADTTVTLGGNALSLGGTAPAIMLDATKTAFDFTYDIAAPVTLLGTTQVGGAGDATLRISGAIDGSGGLTKSNTGTLTLTGANNYTGPTTISAGTLQIGNGGTTGSLSPSSAITNNASLVFNRSNAVTQGADFANAITGSGSVAQSGGNILTLAGTNSHQGGTILNSGTIAFENGSLGTVGNITFLGNSTLQWASGNTQDISGRLVMSNGVTSTIDTNGNDVSFGSAIGNSSTGTLSKTGAGTLTLAGANTYLGDTNVLTGKLQLGSGRQPFACGNPTDPREQCQLCRIRSQRPKPGDCGPCHRRRRDRRQQLGEQLLGHPGHTHRQHRDCFPVFLRRNPEGESGPCENGRGHADPLRFQHLHRPDDPQRGHPRNRRLRQAGQRHLCRRHHHLRRCGPSPQLQLLANPFRCHQRCGIARQGYRRPVDSFRREQLLQRRSDHQERHLAEHDHDHHARVRHGHHGGQRLQRGCLPHREGQLGPLHHQRTRQRLGRHRRERRRLRLHPQRTD